MKPAATQTRVRLRGLWKIKDSTACGGRLPYSYSFGEGYANGERYANGKPLRVYVCIALDFQSVGDEVQYLS